VSDQALADVTRGSVSDVGENLPRSVKQAEMKVQSIRKILRLVLPIWNEMDRMNFSLIAAGVGLFAMLSLFPALAAIVMLWSLVADPSHANALLAPGRGVLPPDVLKLMSDQIDRVIAAGSEQGIGWALLLTLAVSIWSARAGVAALMRGLNAVNRADPRSTWVKETLASLGLTCVLGGLALIAIAAIVIAPIVMAFVPLGPGLEIAADVLRWCITMVVAVLALGAVYRYGPNLRDQKPGWITPGAIVAAVLLLVMSLAFSIYVAQFANYNKVYGSIGAAVALVVWFYLSAYVVLLGGTLNAELDRRGLLRRASDMPGHPQSGTAQPAAPARFQ
jgi:membrane protein